MDCFLTPTTKAIKNQSASFFSPLLEKSFLWLKVKHISRNTALYRYPRQNVRKLQKIKTRWFPRSLSPASPSPYNQYSEAILPEALKVTFPFSSHALLEADFWRICQISI